MEIIRKHANKGECRVDLCGCQLKYTQKLNDQGFCVKETIKEIFHLQSIGNKFFQNILLILVY